MSSFKKYPGICAWCDSEDISYNHLNPFFSGEFIKFKLICNECGKKSVEVFHMEFFETETEID